MPRVKIGPALPDSEKLDAEIARLRDLDVGQLRSRWHTAFGRPAPAHLARHLLFRSLAYRLQADRLGDLDRESERLLDRSGSPEKAGRNAVDLNRHTTELRPGTILGREWSGQMQQVAVLADGFAWNGKTYPSLSKVAFAITGTRWKPVRSMPSSRGRTSNSPPKRARSFTTTRSVFWRTAIVGSARSPRTSRSTRLIAETLAPGFFRVLGPGGLRHSPPWTIDR